MGGKEVIKVQMYVLVAFINMKSQETGEAQTHTDAHCTAIMWPRWATLGESTSSLWEELPAVEKGSFSTETVNSSFPFSLALGLIVPC